jgi:hypothetical protein
LYGTVISFSCWLEIKDGPTSKKLQTWLNPDMNDLNLIVFGLTRSGLELTIYHNWGEHANHYTTDVVSYKKEI